MRKDWDYKLLGDITEKINGLWTGKKPPFIDVMVYTMSNFTKESDLDHSTEPRLIKASVSQYNKRKLVYGDILVEKSGGGPKQPVGRAVLFDVEDDENNTFSNFTTRLRITDNHSQRISSNYLHKFLKYIYMSGMTENFQKNSTNIRNLQMDEYLSVEVPIPTIPEQKQIVSILDKAFAAIDQAKANIEKNIQNAEELFQSKLNEVFSQKGEGWEEKRLGEIGKVSMCKRVFKRETSSVGDIPFYKIGTFGKTPDAFITEELYNEYTTKYSFPNKGDVLISASGTIGRRVIYDGEPAYFQDSNIVWIANDENLVLNEYLYEFYGACDWNPSRGATISRLYNDDLRNMKISFPTKSQQQSIVVQIRTLTDRINNLKAILTNKTYLLDELKASLLSQAFSGELTSSEKKEYTESAV